MTSDINSIFILGRDNDEFLNVTSQFLWNTATLYWKSCPFLSASCVKDVENISINRTMPEKLKKFICDRCRTILYLGETCKLKVDKSTRKRKIPFKTETPKKTQMDKKIGYKVDIARYQLACKICKKKSSINSTIIKRNNKADVHQRPINATTLPNSMTLNSSTKKKRKRKEADAGLNLSGLTPNFNRNDQKPAPIDAVSPLEFLKRDLHASKASTPKMLQTKKLSKLQNLIAQEREKSTKNDLSTFLQSLQ